MGDWDDWKAPIWGLVGLTAGYIIGGTTLPLIYDAAVSDEIEFPSRSYDIVDIISMISIIFEPMSGNPYSVYASDLSGEQIINIFDIVALIELVLNSN